MCHGGKISNGRLIVLFYCNASSSENLQPLVVGKFENPQHGKGVKHLPCPYRTKENVWITGKLL